MDATNTKESEMEYGSKHTLHGVSPRGDKRCVIFEVDSEARVSVAEFELSPVSGWIRVSRVETARAPIARQWYRDYTARGYARAV